MGDLETKLRQAGEELRAIRGHVNILKSIAPKRAEERAAPLTFRSVRHDTQSPKRPTLSVLSNERLDMLKNQFTKLADLDQFVFSYKTRKQSRLDKARPGDAKPLQTRSRERAVSAYE